MDLTHLITTNGFNPSLEATALDEANSGFFHFLSHLVLCGANRFGLVLFTFLSFVVSLIECIMKTT